MPKLQSSTQGHPGIAGITFANIIPGEDFVCSVSDANGRKCQLHKFRKSLHVDSKPSKGIRE